MFQLLKLYSILSIVAIFLENHDDFMSDTIFVKNYVQRFSMLVQYLRDQNDFFSTNISFLKT